MIWAFAFRVLTAPNRGWSLGIHAADFKHKRARRLICQMLLGAPQ
jgi:hypothetical protein